MQPNTVSNPVLSLARSIGKHLNGGILLMLMAALALVVANSSWSDEYFAFWLQPVHLQIGSFNVFNHGGHPLTLLEFINDALMVVFFFSTGMEIKREMLVGELSTVRQALLPVIAACGGMIMPVLIFAYIAYGTPGETGMAIPMATDIAFSLGVLALFSKRVPLNLKIFLTTFAVADDIGGILVIALFYSSHLALEYLLWSAVILAVLCIGNWKGVHSRWFYVGLGLIMWYLFLQSGVHATIAGVIVAFTIPATPQEATGRFAERLHAALKGFRVAPKEDILLDEGQVGTLREMRAASRRVVSPLQKLDANLQGAVNYFILPLFAFANAGEGELKGSGRSIEGVHLRDMLDLVTKKAPGIIKKFGGHAMAAGLTIQADALDAFTQAFEDVVTENTDPDTFERQVLVDGPLSSDEINESLIDAINAQSWGQGFLPPLFANEFKVLRQTALKGGHLKLALEMPDGMRFSAIYFRRAAEIPSRAVLAYRPEINEWMGRRNIQLVVEQLQSD